MKKRTRRRLHAVRHERRAHRNYKDSFFRKLFSEKTKAIELYNALSGTSYDETVPFEFWTLDRYLAQVDIYGEKANDPGRQNAGRNYESTA